MLHSKRYGSRQSSVYHKNDENLVKRSGEIQWVSRIHKALNRNNFILYVQSIVSLQGKSEFHYEFLIRMIGEDGGTIAPGLFLPAAERYDLICKLDRWVLENVFDMLLVNPHFVEKTGMFSINLSGPSLASADILSFITHRLSSGEINTSKLCFEITETAAISNINTALNFINSLKHLGCKFSLDDFGSGLSSFGYLKTLPVDYLKIDGMFVKNIVDEPIDLAMVKSINDVAHVMGMQSIAEYVENDSIRKLLVEIGVDFGQGYGIGKPVPLSEVLDAVR